MALRTLLFAIALGAVLAAAAFVPRSGAKASSTRVARPPACAVACRAAYEAIARALPHDAGNVLARAIVRTPDFSYVDLARAMHVPTAAQIVARWRAASGG